MTETVAPQEDQLILPASWAARLLPRRGRRPGPRVDLAPDAAAELRRRIDEHADPLRRALELPENADHRAAAAAFLGGAPDPRGAAVTAALLTDVRARYRTSWLRPEFDAWAGEHGVAFAVAAAVERLVVTTLRLAVHSDAIEERVIGLDTAAYPHMLARELDQGGIAAVRAVLAGLADEDYAAVAAALAEHRDTPAKRFAVALLLPDESAWVLESCAEYATYRRSGRSDEAFLHSLGTAEHLAAAALAELSRDHADAGSAAALLDAAGAAALPVLARTAAAPSNADFTKLIHRAISLVPSDDAMAYLLDRLSEPYVFEAAAEAAARFPVRALRAVIERAPSAPPERRFQLIALAVPIAPDARPRLGAAERDALDALLADGERVPEAAPEELPRLLTAPPWTVERPKPAPVVIEGLDELVETRLAWAEGEQAAWAALQPLDSFGDDRWDDEAAEREIHRDPTDRTLGGYLAFGPADRAAPLLEHWTGRAMDPHHVRRRRIVARYGAKAADRALASAHERFAELPGPILSVAAARRSAERLTGPKATRPAGLQWFARHGLDAVPYLVPDALGTDAKRRRSAETALAHLTAHHGADAVAARCAPLGEAAAAAIAALVGGDPLEPRAVKVPKPGPWASPAILPQVLLAGGERALPPASIPHLLTVLALATPDHPYPGIDVVAQVCDRASLARFGRALFQLWLSVGGPGKDLWVLTQLAHFADDETVEVLAAQVRAWPGQSQHKRASTGLQVLGAIGTEAALRAVQGIADKVKFKALKDEAARQITAIAGDLGLTREQLADRLVPDLGLGEEAALVLDYGPRSFTVAFDEHLKPYVVDDAGRPRKSLPRPGAKDDPALAEESHRRFTVLKKELRTVAADQVQRLEAAMAAGRSWSAGEFRRYFVEHPLTGHLARRLVWLADAGGERTAFRIAEDGTFGDVEDDAFDLPDDAAVRLAHPVHLGPDGVGAWAAVLSDYEILQPFDQLSRPAMAFTEAELATGRLARFEGATVAVGSLLGLTKRGWERAAPEGGGVEPGIFRALPGGGAVKVVLHPGIWAGDVNEHPEQTLREVRLVDGEVQWWRRDERDANDAKEIDPAVASEVLAALARLTGAG